MSLLELEINRSAPTSFAKKQYFQDVNESPTFFTRYWCDLCCNIISLFPLLRQGPASAVMLRKECDMTRFFLAVVTTAVLLVAGGCRPAFDPPPHPAKVSHMNVVKKKAHIDSAKSTLKIFRASAQDLRTRDKPDELETLSEEVERYIKLQVQPVVRDFEASNNLSTRLEIAKLQLLCGLVYLELDNAESNIYNLLQDMERRYGDQPDVLNAAIDRNDVGFDTISDGMRSLDEWRFR
jgi:hypothetical protein